MQNADLSERLEEEEANSAQLLAAKKKFEMQAEELTHDLETAENNITRLDKDKQVRIKKRKLRNKPISEVVKNITNSAVSLGFDAQAGQRGHSIATVATFLRSCVAQALNRGDGPATSHTLRRNTTSVMQIFLKEEVFP